MNRIKDIFYYLKFRLKLCISLYKTRRLIRACNNTIYMLTKRKVEIARARNKIEMTLSKMQ